MRSARSSHSCHECDDDAKHMTAMPARGRRGDSVVAVAPCGKALLPLTVFCGMLSSKFPKALHVLHCRSNA